MNIAIFTNNYLPNPYGVTGSIESFRKEFERLGHVVYIFAPHAESFADENPNVFRYPSFDIKYRISFPLAIPYSRRIDKILEKLEVDVIHSQHPNLLGWAARKWAGKKNVPLIFTWHTLYDQYTNFVPFIPKKIAGDWAIKNAAKYANLCDEVIIPTESVKKIIQSWGLENKNTEVIPTGVDEKQMNNPDGKAVRKKFGIKDEEILLVTITRFTEEKNIEFLFRSVAKVLKENSRIKFLAGGNGYLTDELEKFIKNENLENRVIFTGFIPNDIKKNYYAAGDIFVFASKSETQGMIISEAHYLGLPIVAVDATGPKDIIKNGETGFLVSENEEEFANAVAKLAEDADMRKKFSENAGKVARENYTSGVSAAKMLEVYEKAIERKKI